MIVWLLAGCGSVTETDTARAESAARRAEASQVNGLTVPLRSGWNPVGFQALRLTALGANPAVSGFARWTGSSYTLGNFNLAELADARRAVWLYATGDTSITYSGQDDGEPLWELTNGFQMLSFCTSVDIPGSRLRASQNGAPVGLASVVLPQFFELAPDGSSTTVDVQAGGVLKPGRAYWVFANTSSGPVRLSLAPGAEIRSLRLTPTSALLDQYAEVQFTLTATLADGSTQDVTSQAAWTSADPSVAAVLSPGRVKGLNLAATQVRASLPPLSAEAPVTVVSRAVPGPLKPSVTGVSPAAGPLTGGTLVTITGESLSGATAVFFGATPGTAITPLGDTSLTVLAPAGVAGTVDIRVTTPVGGSAPNPPAAQYTYTPPPTVTGLSPTAGPLTAGTSVTITGTNLLGTTAVTFGGVAGTGVTVNSPTSVTVSAPAGTAGTVDVRVTTAGGQSATSAADQYTYTSPPTVTSLSAAVGPLAGGGSVVITGTNLSGASAVSFGGTAATITANTNTNITVTVPAAAAMNWVDVNVTTAGGTSASSVADTYYYFEMAARTSGTTNPLNSVCAGPSYYLAVGDGPDVRTSLDGTTWSAGVTTNVSLSPKTVIYWGDANNPTFLAGGPQTINRNATPSTGAWFAFTTGILVQLNGAASGNGFGVTVGTTTVSGGDGPGVAIYSPSFGAIGVNKIVPNSAQTFRAVAHGNGNRYVAVGTDAIIYRADVTAVTQSWSLSPAPGGLTGTLLNGIAFDGSRFVTVGTGGTILRSTDSLGTAFDATGVTSGTAQTLNAVTRGTVTSGSLLLAVGNSGTLLLSRDGLTWVTAAAPGGTGDLLGVTFGSGRFVAVGAGGTILTTP